jgi:hypothetical protein
LNAQKYAHKNIKCTKNCAYKLTNAHKIVQEKTKNMKCTKKCALIYLFKTVLKDQEVRLERIFSLFGEKAIGVFPAERLWG